jgi:RNA polymerase sigma factor (sigma-70 family)
VRVAPSDPEQTLIWAAEILCEHRQRELDLACSYRACAGLTREELEELFQVTALELLDRGYEDELHLLRAFRSGLKYRALNHHRDERGRRAILTRHAISIQSNHSNSVDEEPERQALAREERYVIEEFVRGLNPAEQRLLWLISEGVSTRRLAKALGVSAEQLYATKVSYERKRETFTQLYSTGRLCGYRSHTIARLKERQQTSPELAERAIAHLKACPRCRAEHQITARRLRAIFEQQAAAALPLPLLLTHTRWFTRIVHRAGRLSLHTNYLHTRVANVFANTTPTMRLAAPLAATLLAAGAIGVTHTLNYSASHSRHHAAPAVVPLRAVPLRSLPATTAYERPVLTGRLRIRHSTASAHVFGPGRVVSVHPSAAPQPEQQRTPGGFAYLGATPPVPHTLMPLKQTHIAGGGGEFSP